LVSREKGNKSKLNENENQNIFIFILFFSLFFSLHPKSQNPLYRKLYPEGVVVGSPPHNPKGYTPDYKLTI
jgi:hypothetical protein